MVSQWLKGLDDLGLHRNVIHHAEVEVVHVEEVEPVLVEELHRVGVMTEEEVSQHSHQPLDGLLHERVDRRSIVCKGESSGGKRDGNVLVLQEREGRGRGERRERKEGKKGKGVRGSERVDTLRCSNICHIQKEKVFNFVEFFL